MSDQSESSAVFNILAFAFQGEDTAQIVNKEVKSSGALDDLWYCCPGNHRSEREGQGR